MYTTQWCPDCRRVKMFLQNKGIAFQEVNIEEDPDAEEIVLRVNQGRRKVPTLKMGEKYFACSPYNAHELAENLGIPLNS